MTTIVGGPTVRSPVSMFRFEVEGVDVHATKVSAVSLTLNIIKTEEGGSKEITDQSTNGVKPEPITVERPATVDAIFTDWVANLRLGQQDRRLCAIFQQDAEGTDIFRWELVDCYVASLKTIDWDGSTKDAEQKEVIEIHPRIARDRETLI